MPPEPQNDSQTIAVAMSGGVDSSAVAASKGALPVSRKYSVIAGFLTAAREFGVKPDLVTATSGQIIVLGEWLRGTDLKNFLIDTSRLQGPIGTLLTACIGDPGIFRAAVPEYWRRWTRWPATPPRCRRWCGRRPCPCGGWPR